MRTREKKTVGRWE